MKNIAKAIAYWTLPAGFYGLLRGMSWKSYAFSAGHRSLLKQNARFKDRYRGKRCFIVGNGPSVVKQDLLLLKNEHVFSVSNGYHHKDYQSVRPAFHCVPQLSYSDIFTQEYALKWFEEMNANIVDAELFFYSGERELIESNKLFTGKKVNYLCFGRKFLPHETGLTNLTKVIPTPQSVPVMCIMIAMYMGFSQIYMIGVEHDSFITGEYKYFFKPTIKHGKDGGVTAEGKITDPLYDQFLVHRNLWFQYIVLKNIAEANDISIYNATAGGALDVYPRVSYEELFRS